MSSSKIAVALLFGALLVPTYAQAQLDTTSDLVVEKVEIGSRRVVGIAAPINVTIRNVGSGTFNAPSGWSIFVGLDGGTQNDCIETDSPNAGSSSAAGATLASPCYQRTTTATTGGASAANQIAPGGTARFTIPWNASTTQATDESVGAQIVVEILGSTESAHESFAGCSGPDAVCENNIHREEIFVGVNGVRARPERDVTESVADAGVNDAWSREEARAMKCPAPPEPVRKACLAMPGSTVLALYTVTNTGTIHDAFVPSAVDPQALQSQGYIFGFAPATVDLDPRQSKEAKVTITFPEDAESGTPFNVDLARAKVNWRSTLNPRASTADTNAPGCTPEIRDAGLCADASMPTFVVDTRRGANVTANDSWVAIERGVSHTFKVNLNNTGNAPDRYRLKVDNQTWSISEAWKVNFTVPDSLLDPRANDNATVGFYVPPDTLNGTYEFDVVVESVFDTGAITCVANNVRSPGQCRVHFTVHVKQDWSLASSSDVPARVLPGQRATYNLAVRNNGNGWDNITLDLQSTVGNWNAQLSNTTLRLAPGAIAPFSLGVTPPPNTPDATEAFFYVNATSSGPLEGAAERAKAEMIVSKLTVLPGPNIGLTTPLNASFVDLGRSVDFEVNVQNTGNRADNFTIGGLPGNPNWGVTVAPTYAQLAPLESATVHVTLRAPTFADVGEKTSVLVTVRSTADPDKTGQISLEGRISGPDIYLDAIRLSPSAPYSGDDVEISVGLGNAGNKVSDRNVTMRVFFVQEGVERLIANKTFTAAEIPAQRHISETFVWKTEGAEGTGVILARLDMNGAKEIDDSPESNERSVPVTLRTFDIHVVAATGRTARPGESVTYGDPPYAFVIEYRGNQLNEPVTVQFESEHGWLSSPAEVPYNLPRGTPIPVVAKLDIPERPGASKDRLSIRVIPSLRADTPLTASTITSILDEENPKVLGILATPATATIGGDVTIDVLVSDATGISSARAFITTPTNETTAVPLARKSADTWTASQSFTLAGRHRVTVEVTDAADPPNVNKTRDTIGEFTITPGSQPVIRLAPDQSSTIRTGSFIRLDITDPLGVAKASYAIKGVVYELRGPTWQIDTSTFPAGAIELNVTAENIYGVQGSATFRFTVDNTIPGISKVTLDPQRPKANEDVTVTISTDAKVQAVDVLVKRNGQVVETINATKKAAGSFQFTFNPGEGDYTLDVTARDSAGNTKLAPGIVTFSAKPGSPFEVPMPGPVWVLLALAAVAVLVRRRTA